MPTIATDLPMQDAVDMLTRKVPVGSGMDSREWALLPSEIKLRAMFSAKVESERLLVEMQERLQARMELAKRDGRHVTRSVFIEEMRQEVIDSGYKKPDGVKRGSLRDLRSTRRLGLIFDMNVSQAQGYARWLTDMTPGMLAAAPAQELIRVMQRVEIRDWPLIWQDHGGKFYGEPGPDYPSAPGRMIALKTDPIWRWISRFKTPWPPFDWGSGMGLRNVRRKEAIALGLIHPKQVLTPLKQPFNEGARMNIKTLPEAGRKRILDALAGDVEIVGDEIRILPPDALDAMAGGGSRPGKILFDGVNQAPPQVSPRPLSEVITVLGHSEAAAQIRAGILKADAEHGDGVLPVIEVVVRTPILRPEIAGEYQPVSVPSLVPFLRINPNAVDVEFSTLHEIGHLLDNLGLHTPSLKRLYASEGQPELRDMMQAIRRSVAAGRLSARYGPDSYLLSLRELFARAYAQFIAERSGDERLLETVRGIRRGDFEDFLLYKNSQWTAGDFNPIRRAMRELFNLAGWRYGR